MNESLPKLESNYLYLNTAQPEATIGLLSKENIFEKWEAGRELSATLSGKVTELLKKEKIKKEELAGVVVFLGPGSFTGLRIGIAFANAFAFGLGIPVFAGDEQGNFDRGKPQKQALPHYGAEPNITKPRQK